MPFRSVPSARGLYSPDLEKSSCGVGFIANFYSNASRKPVFSGSCVLPESSSETKIYLLVERLP